jgi:dTDP-glucose 4,6-dehydratase
LSDGAYARGKRAAEELCREACGRGGLAATIARCFAFVGPYLPLNGHFAIGNFIRDALAGGPIRVQGDGTPLRSYLYAADLTIWLWTILFRGAPARPYNVGSSQGLTIRDLAERAGSLFGVPVCVSQEPTPGQMASRYVPDTERARMELGLEVWVPLEGAIRKTARWNAERSARTISSL